MLVGCHLMHKRNLTVSSAMFGLIAYPTQGIYKSMRESVHKGFKGRVQMSKEAIFEEYCRSTKSTSSSQVVQKFHSS